MYENELKEIHGKIAQVLKMKREQLPEAIALIEAEKENAARILPEDSLEHYSILVTLEESQGDLYQRSKQLKKAAECYDRMAKAAEILFQRDKTKYSFQKAAALYKQAGCVRISINCLVMTPVPRELNEQENKFYQLAMSRYKEAARLLLTGAQVGITRNVEMMSNCLIDMAVMHGVVGNYKEALECARNAVSLDKNLYETIDDKQHSMRVALHMNLLALIYNLMKNVEMAMETLEDAIYALGEHEQEDPIQFGITIGRFQMNLANCYQYSRTEKKQAEGTYLNALSNIKAVNDNTNGKFVLDLVSAFQAVGRYYISMGNRKEADSYLNNGILLADEAFTQTGLQLYQQLAEQMRKMVSEG